MTRYLKAKTQTEKAVAVQKMAQDQAQVQGQSEVDLLQAAAMVQLTGTGGRVNVTA